MATHASDWGCPLNIRLRGANSSPQVMMFVGGVVLVINGILEVFLPYKSYGAGVFR
jgi:hypothetical protein